MSIDRVLGDVTAETPPRPTGPRYKPRLRDVTNAKRACNRRAVRSRTYDDGDAKAPKPPKAKAIPKARVPVSQAPAAGRSNNKLARQPVAHDGFDHDKDASTPYISLAKVGRQISESDSDGADASSFVESMHKTTGGDLSERDYESEAESIRSSCSACSVVARPPARVRTGSINASASDNAIVLVEDAVADEW